MTITDDEGRTISEKDAIKTSMAILENYDASGDDDFSKGIRALREVIVKRRRGAP